jgi:Protein of unknown function (DUF2948)
MTEKLRLKAEDREDLAVIAACLQDALVLVGDLAHMPDDQEFVMVVNRFGWEAAARGRPMMRITCGVVFGGVTGIETRGFDRQDSDRILSLLTLKAHDGGIELVFSGRAALRLLTPSIRCRIEDVGESWPTSWRPQHERG